MLGKDVCVCVCAEDLIYHACQHLGEEDKRSLLRLCGCPCPQLLRWCGGGLSARPFASGYTIAPGHPGPVLHIGGVVGLRKSAGRHGNACRLLNAAVMALTSKMTWTTIAIMLNKVGMHTDRWKHGPQKLGAAAPSFAVHRRSVQVVNATHC